MSRETARRNLVIVGASIPTTMSFTTLAPVIHKIDAALAYSPADGLLVRLSLTIVGFGMILGGPLIGALSDRWGPRGLLLGSLFAWTLLGFVPMVIHDLVLLVVVRGFQGLAAAGCITIGLALLTEERDPIARARLAGRHVAVASMVGVVTLMAAGKLGEWGWETPLLLHGIGFLLAIAVVRLPARVASAVAQAPAADSPSPVDAGRNILWMFCGIALLTGIVTYSVTTFLPYRFHEVCIDRTDLISLALIVQAIASTGSSLVFGRARQKLVAPWLFALAFVACGVGTVVTATTSSYMCFLLAMLLFGSGIGWFSPNLMSIVAGTVSEGARGRVMGIVKSANTAAALVGALLFEPLMRWGGAQLVFAVVAATCLAAAAVSSFFGLRHKHA